LVVLVREVNDKGKLESRNLDRIETLHHRETVGGLAHLS